MLKNKVKGRLKDFLLILFFDLSLIFFSWKVRHGKTNKFIFLPMV